MSHIVTRLLERTTLIAAEAKFVAEQLRHSASIKFNLDRAVPSRFPENQTRRRYRAVIDGSPFHIIYDSADDSIVTAFHSNETSIGGHRIPEIHPLF